MHCLRVDPRKCPGVAADVRSGPPLQNDAVSARLHARFPHSCASRIPARRAKRAPRSAWPPYLWSLAQARGWNISNFHGDLGKDSRLAGEQNTETFECLLRIWIDR